MSYATRRIRFPLAVALGFVASGGVAAWYMQFSTAGLIAWAGFAVAGLICAAVVSRAPT